MVRSANSSLFYMDKSFPKSNPKRWVSECKMVLVVYRGSAHVRENQLSAITNLAGFFVPSPPATNTSYSPRAFPGASQTQLFYSYNVGHPSILCSSFTSPAFWFALVTFRYLNYYPMLWDLHNNPRNRCSFHVHFTDDITEAQSGCTVRVKKWGSSKKDSYSGLSADALLALLPCYCLLPDFLEKNVERALISNTLTLLILKTNDLVLYLLIFYKLLYMILISKGGYEIPLMWILMKNNLE